MTKSQDRNALGALADRFGGLFGKRCRAPDRHRDFQPVVPSGQRQATKPGGPAQPEEAARFAAWFAGKEFTTDWVTGKLPSWLAALDGIRQKPDTVHVLEVGSYEGRSAVAFLEMMPQCRITAIDTFPKEDIEARFDLNLSGYGDRCTKIKGRAIGALDSLRQERASFDIIYLDAGKIPEDTFVQSALAWSLLKQGGVLIWDDLTWKRDNPPHERPATAIELFANAFGPALEVLHRGRQLIVRKKADWPG
jgi:predicted O-methyltransferase YrrM